ASPPPHRHNLPRSVEALIGRAQELAQLQSLLAAHRLVTVTGPGGVGKSRLVLDAAWAGIDRYADGVWLVELAALADPALVPSAVTTALAIDVAPAESPLSALTHRLGNAALLIVLDNCEHVIGAVAALLEAVLASAPNVHALVSSQELIGIGGEHVFRLPSLAVPAETNPTSQAALATGAVQLFVARAQAADPRFALDEHAASAVAAICRRLDGIPLALEMAAARVPLLGVDGLAARLDERFRVLTAGKRTALPRQRTLQATLDWSFGLLSPREQAVCRRLGVFAAPFALAAAAAVATDVDDDEFAVIESLAGLCDKSLVAADPGEGDVRYRLLDSTRAYALERLAAAQETAATMRRHALFLRRSFEHCFDDWTRRSDADFRTRYAPELDDLRSAIAWAFGADGEGDTAIALVASSVRLWLNLSLYAEIDALLRRAEERLTPATPPALRAELSLAAASTSGQRNHQAAIRGARTAAEIYRSLGDELRLGCALHALGSAHAGELDAEAESVLAEARPLLERTGRPRLRAMAHGAIALFHGALGRSDEAIRETHAALALYREGGADNAVLRTLVALADQYWQQGDLERAIAFAGDVLEQHRRSPFADRVSRDYATGNLCGMLVEHGELAQARELARPLLPELAELNILHGWTDHFASLLARGGRIADAVRLVGWADAIRSAKGLRRQPNEQRAREGVLAMANEDQSTAAVERLLAEGSRLDAQAACRLASP
ncbi:MAG: hypothetical protein MUC32_10685, partial [Burkholderiaceae bacterium]|nr:hypothetical protein [Burkholderiaceae bacterium]